MNENTRNMLIATVLAMGVFFTWNELYLRPKLEAEQATMAAQDLTKSATQAQTQTPAATPQAPGTGTPQLPGEAAKAEAKAAPAPRVVIETPNLKGSLSLRGARLDDLKLVKHTDKLGADAKPVVLFDEGTHYADLGWTARAELGLKLPDANTLWTASSKLLTPETPLTLTWDNGAGLVFTRRLSVDKDFMFTVEDSVANKTGAPVAIANYGLVHHSGTQMDGGLASVVFEGPHGVFNGTLKEVKYSEFDKTPEVTEQSAGGWLGITEKYWMATLIPAQDKQITGRFLRLNKAEGPTYQADYLMPEQVVAPATTSTITNHLFAGAKINSVIADYQAAYNITNFDRSIDWGWFYFLTKPMFWTLDKLHKAVGNFGVAIILLTIIVKAIFYPLATKQYESMTKMKAVQPKMKALQERYKDDKPRLQQEMMELYKKEKINPATGCLPMIVQIPVFFALYKTLYVTIEMRHQPFFGWIHDLSAPDPSYFVNLFGFAPWDAAPYLPGFLLVGIWPILMGVTMWLQQKMNPAAGDPIQQKMMNFLPLIFTFLLAPMPAGLVIYWTANTVLSGAQQWLIMRKMGVKVGD